MPVGTPDHALLTRARDGDGEAFEALYRRHHRAATRAAHSYSSRGQLAEDAVQEAFLRILNTTRRGGGPENEFRAYLATTVRHVIAGWTRNDQTIASDDLEALAGEDVRDSSAPESRLRWHLLTKAFRSLPTRWQEALWLGEVEGVSVTELAERWNMAPNSASALAYRAREGLRTAWLEAHINEGLVPDGCRPFVTDLGRFAQDKLSERRSVQVREHLDECSYCRAVLLEVGQAASELRVLLLPVVLWGGAAVAGTAGAAGIGAAFLGGKAGGNTTRTIAIGASAIAAVAIVALALALIQPWSNDAPSDADGGSSSGASGASNSASGTSDPDDPSSSTSTTDSSARTDDSETDAGSDADDTDTGDTGDTNNPGRNSNRTSNNGTQGSGSTDSGAGSGTGTQSGNPGTSGGGNPGGGNPGGGGPGGGGPAPAPAPPALALDTQISGSTALLAGTATPGATITIRDLAGTPYATTTAASSGSWDLQVTSDSILSPGGLTLLATQTLNGATSGASPPFTLLNNVPRPALAVQTINGNDATITGTAQPGARVDISAAVPVGGGAGANSVAPRILANPGTLATTTANSDGSWELVVQDARISGGGLLLQATATVGQTTSPASATIEANNNVPIPTRPQSISIDGIGAFLAGNAEPGALLVLTIDGVELTSTTVATDGSWSVAVTDERIGHAGLVVRTAQRVANITSPASETIDLTNPVAIPMIAEILAIAGPSATLAGQGEPGAVVSIFSDEAEAALATATVHADGWWKVEITHEALAGPGLLVWAQQHWQGINSAASDSFEVVNSFTAPTIWEPQDFDGAVAWLHGAGSPGATVEVMSAAGEVLGSAAVNGEGTWTVELKHEGIVGEGLQVRARQLLDGSTSGWSDPLVVLNPLPQPSGHYRVEDGAARFFAGVGTPGATVWIRDTNDVDLASAQVAEDGSWETTVFDDRIQNGLWVYAVQVQGSITSPRTDSVVLWYDPTP